MTQVVFTEKDLVSNICENNLGNVQDMPLTDIQHRETEPV